MSHLTIPAMAWTYDLSRALTEIKRARNAIELTRARGEEAAYSESMEAINRVFELLTARLYDRQHQEDRKEAP